MERNEYCPLVENCSVYLNNINHSEMVGLTYRSLYCLQGNKKYKVCKRYHAFTKLGKPAPPDILPNSSFDME
jgi:hypothetical protein